uniref:Uncharacterized protein n=1 Tax=Nothobranchius rachovii TaxID=451742 RepID=A0A1A8SCA9_9TELE
MDPAVLIFLLYVMIAHELVCGLMHHRRQSDKPRRRAAGPLLRSSARVCRGVWRAASQPYSPNRGGRDLRKSGRFHLKVVENKKNSNIYSSLYERHVRDSPETGPATVWCLPFDVHQKEGAHYSCSDPTQLHWLPVRYRIQF